MKVTKKNFNEVKNYLRNIVVEKNMFGVSNELRDEKMVEFDQTTTWSELKKLIESWPMFYYTCVVLPDDTYKFLNWDGNVHAIETHKDGYAHGPSESFHSNGNIQLRCTYNMGYRSGLCEWFYDNGNKSTIYNYDEWQTQEGLQQHFHENGVLWQEYECVCDELHGFYKEYDETGNLVCHEIYENDKLVKKVV